MVNAAVRKSGYLFEYRLTFLGAKKVGKTSVMNRFMNDTFSHRYRPTIEDHLTHIVDHNGNMCVCLLVDTAGGNDFPAMRRLAINKGNAFLVFYSIADRRTFEEAKRIVKEIKSLKNPSEDVKIIVIGNKTDLKDEREVKTSEGEELVRDLDQLNVTSQFFEVSAKMHMNIDRPFTSLLNMFIPVIQIVPNTPERSTFSRMSLKRKSKKHTLRKQSASERIEQIEKENTNYFSDSDVSAHKSISPGSQNTDSGLQIGGRLLRSSSEDQHVGFNSNNNGHDKTRHSPSQSPNNSPNDSPCSSPNHSPKNDRRRHSIFKKKKKIC